MNFQDKTTEDIYHGTNSKDARKVPMQIWPQVARKLDLINVAHALKDLLAPPGNRLEELKGNLKEFYSIRINDQYRIIFKWSNGNASSIKITDYHK